MYIYIHTFECVYIYMLVYNKCMYACMYACRFVCMYICVCTHACMCIPVSIFIYICIHIYIDAYSHVHVHIHIYINIYLSICTHRCTGSGASALLLMSIIKDVISCTSSSMYANKHAHVLTCTYIVVHVPKTQCFCATLGSSDPYH